MLFLLLVKIENAKHEMIRILHFQNSTKLQTNEEVKQLAGETNSKPLWSGLTEDLRGSRKESVTVTKGLESYFQRNCVINPDNPYKDEIM